MFEGSNRYFDQALCSGLTITDEEIDALCKSMKEQAVKNAHTEGQKASIKDVGRQQLRSWGILIERDGKDYPSNAYAILTGHGGLHVATQCGVFKGTTKAVFVEQMCIRDRKEPRSRQVSRRKDIVRKHCSRLHVRCMKQLRNVLPRRMQLLMAR